MVLIQLGVGGKVKNVISWRKRFAFLFSRLLLHIYRRLRIDVFDFVSLQLRKLQVLLGIAESEHRVGWASGASFLLGELDETVNGKVRNRKLFDKVGTITNE